MGRWMDRSTDCCIDVWS